MTEEQKLMERFGQDSGMRVPVGYFDSAFKQIADSLPAYPEVERRSPLTKWQRVKPYVYLAAMFAGIWCMMQMFHRLSNVDGVSLENPPAQIAALIEEPEMKENYYIPTSLTDYDLEEQAIESYSDMDDFEEDFGYDFEPEYENMAL